VEGWLWIAVVVVVVAVVVSRIDCNFVSLESGTRSGTRIRNLGVLRMLGVVVVVIGGDIVAEEGESSLWC
jgi:hypothetical protein